MCFLLSYESFGAAGKTYIFLKRDFFFFPPPGHEYITCEEMKFIKNS